jgi:hypothetical protein
MSDIATQLNNVLTRDGILGPTSAFKLIDGNVSVPGLGFNSEPGLGLYRINTSILGFAAAGKQTIVNDASSAGTVITSLYPRSVGQAEVRLNSDIYGTADTTVLRLAQAPAGGIIQSLAVGAGAAKPILYTASAHSFTGPVISEPNSLSSRFIADRALDVAGIGSFDMTTTDSLRFRLQYGAGSGETSNAGNFSIYRYQNDGSTSENAFDIDRASGVVTMQRQLQVGTAQTTGQTSLIVTRQSQFGEQVGVTASGTAINCSAGAVSATAYTATAAAGLAVGGWVADGGNWLSQVCTGNPNSQVQLFQAYRVTGTWEGFRMVTGGSSVFEFRNTGFGVNTNGWTTFSDSRIKKDKAEISAALDKLSKLTGYEYTNTLNGIRAAGLLAQDVEEVLPVSVLQNPPTEEEPEPIRSLNYDGVTALLVNAVNELNRKVDALTLIH